MENNDRLISANEFMGMFCKHCHKFRPEKLCVPANCSIKRVIDMAPTVDAVEVKHGQWINKSTIELPFFDYRFDCSVCGCIFWHAGIDSFAYCPFCGAKMDGGTVNG